MVFHKKWLFIRLKQKSKSFKKPYFTKSRSRTPNNIVGAICNNSLQLNSVHHYSTVRKSFILNIGRGNDIDYYNLKTCHVQYSMLLHIIRMSFACQYSLISFFMSFVCARMWLVCHSYVTRMCSYISMLLVRRPYVTCISLVCHSYITRMYPFVTRVYHSYVCVCHPYLTHMYSYVTRISFACTCMSSVYHSYVVLPWTLFFSFCYKWQDYVKFLLYFLI